MSGNGEWGENDDGEVEYALVMPFVVCASQGGPYEDEAFVAGYALGHLDEQFERGAVDFGSWQMIRTESLPQVDLIAMKHDAIAECHPNEELPEWSAVRFLSHMPLGDGPR